MAESVENALFNNSVIAQSPMPETIATPSFEDTVIMSPLNARPISFVPTAATTTTSAINVTEHDEMSELPETIAYTYADLSSMEYNLSTPAIPLMPLITTNSQVNNFDNENVSESTSLLYLIEAPESASDKIETTVPVSPIDVSLPTPMTASTTVVTSSLSSKTSNNDVTVRNSSTSVIKSPSTSTYISRLTNNKNTQFMGVVHKKKAKQKLTKEQKYIMTNIPPLNKMVYFQVTRLLKARARYMKRNPTVKMNPDTPIAILTAYSVSKVPTSSSYRAQKILRDKAFCGDYLPIICQTITAVIHLDKFFCPGTYRYCIEHHDTLITPLELMEKSGFKHVNNWQTFIIACNGRSLKSMMAAGKLNYANHLNFCTRQCETFCKKSKES